MDNPFEPDVLLEARGDILLMTLNRPERRNAVNDTLHAALAGVWRHAAAIPGIRAAVLTGAGKGFCAGGDMDTIQRLHNDPLDRLRMLDEARTIVREMVEFPLPIVAAVNGAAMGLGCSLAVTCDVVFMGESSVLGDPHVAVGLTAGDGGAATWPLLTSLLHAKEFLYTGDPIPAERAVSMGLANRVVPDAALLDEALAFAARLAALPQQAVQSTKRALNIHLSRAIAGPLDHAIAAEYQSFDMPEHRARIAAFLS